MLRKIGQASLGLVCLIAVSFVAYAAEETAAALGTPTIGELAAFAQTPAQPAAAGDEGAASTAKTPVQPAEAAAAAPVAANAAPTTQDVLAEFAAQREVAAQAKRVKAADLAQQAHERLYTENNADEAYKLAIQALTLDPENKQAAEVRIAAAGMLGIPGAWQGLADDAARLPNVRTQSALQSLNNAIVSAREHYAAGRFEEALKELRTARFTVDFLAVYTDVSAQSQQVEAMMADVQRDYDIDQRKKAAIAKTEAAAAADAHIKNITEQERKKQQRDAQEVMNLIDDARFDEARQVIDDMGLVDPSDSIVPLLLERWSRKKHEYEMSVLNPGMERGDLVFEEWTTKQEIVPERTFNYPDKRVWKTVIEAREPRPYPSETAPPGSDTLDKAVYDKLNDPVSLRFVETPLAQVVTFLQETTNVSISLRRQDVPMDGAPVTLSLDTTLRNGLDQITELTGMAWKVSGGLVKIGSAESMRTYDMRVYNVTDLLLSIEDRSGSTDNGNESSGLGSSGSSSGSSSRNRGGITGQFSSSGSRSSSNSSSNSGNDENDEGFTDLTTRAENLILLMKQACGAETWEDLYGASVIDSAGESSTGGTSGFGSTFGASTGGAARRGGATGFGGEPDYGTPGFGGAPGFGTGATMAQAAPQLPQGRAFVMANDPQNIMVVQTPDVHKCIESLLKELRAAMKIQIQVDVRFLSVSADFLREVGFNWSHFNLNPDGYDANGNLEGVGVSSPSYGGYVPWVEPGGEMAFDSTGNLIGFTDALDFGFGHPFADPGLTFDSDTLQFTYTKTALTGTSFINTGIPFFGTSAGGLSLDLGYAGAIDLAGSFKMGHSKDEAKTLSAPTITLSNGQLGFITVATDLDYISTYEVQDSVLIPTIETVSDAVQLEVRPIASADLKYVFLELSPTILQTDLTHTAPFTTFVGQPGGEGGASGAAVQNFLTLPRVHEQTMETTVGVPDRGVLIVGGLTSTSRVQHETGVPILDKIPLIKRIFSAEGREISRERLFIMARPEIIILGEEEARMR